MCGIVGFLDKKNKLSSTQKQALIEGMVQAIDHRGRDDRGSYIKNNVAVGQTRLSIIDLSPNGAQPFFNQDKTVILSYNGEIYNYQAVNQVLAKKKYVLKSNCDTETLLYAFMDEGVACLKQLNGMFAFSLYDEKSATITLAVDRFSIKPLYYIDTPDWFAWSSEVKSLLLLPGFKAELNEKKLSEYFLFRQVSGAETLFNNIQRVLPAQVITCDLKAGKLSKDRYWKLEKKDFGQINFEDVLLEKLEHSVSSHLLADVPVGVQLSGGVDSSLVVALASRHKKDLNTYSIGLADQKWNEFEYSRLVAKKYNTVHHELVFTEDDFCRELPTLTYFHDEPIGHSHSVPMYLLAKEARKDVKVLLSGEGADEVFFGYKRYLNLYQQPPNTEGVVFSNAIGKIDLMEKVFSPSHSPVATLNYRQNILSAVSDLSWVDQISYYDLQTYLPPLLLRQDKMGMAANLENRVPFLDYQLVEFGFSLPEIYKINNKENKILLKKVASRFLPEQLIYRRKCGFAQPLRAWLKNEEGFGAYLRFFSKQNERRTFLNYDFIRNLIAEHSTDIADHTEILWTLIGLELWLRIFIDGIKPEKIKAGL